MRFVVHRHQATHLHRDLRLEMEGVLKSWAVPKELPTKPGIKRLAIQVEDHDISYIDFEGSIPEGEYRAGRVAIWDSGEAGLLSHNKKKIEVIFEGRKLKGEFSLINFKGKNWLFFKKKV